MNNPSRMHKGAQMLETEHSAALLAHPTLQESQNHTVNSSSGFFPQLVTLVHATARSKVLCLEVLV